MLPRAGGIMRLTERVASTAGLEAGQDDRIFFDDQITGFGLRVRRIKKWNGAYSNKPPARSWLFQYRIGGKTRRLVIGQAPAVKAGRGPGGAAEVPPHSPPTRPPPTEKRGAAERAAGTHRRRGGKETPPHSGA